MLLLFLLMVFNGSYGSICDHPSRYIVCRSFRHGLCYTTYQPVSIVYVGLQFTVYLLNFSDEKHYFQYLYQFWQKLFTTMVQIEIAFYSIGLKRSSSGKAKFPVHYAASKKR